MADLTPAAIALNRFGLGARVSDSARSDPKAWLRAQFARYEIAPRAFAALPDAGAAFAAYREEQMANRKGAAKTEATMAAMKDARQDVQVLYRQGVAARTLSALDTPAPFVERLAHFWSNHFAISANGPQVTAYAGAFEAEAIRPHVLGRFEDMLVAVVRHPAMLYFLDQARSVGPGSPQAARVAQRNANRKPGLNENLAREVMELHTLGVRSGYSQADVTEFARALTGWTLAGAGAPGRASQVMAQNEGTGGFLFRPQTHEPGARTVLGKRYDQPGEDQARAILRDLAAAPATATHLATKLARHFAGDAPPPALVERLARAYRAGGGALVPVYQVLIDAPETWVNTPVKFKSPWEWMVSALRATGRTTLERMQPAALMTQLGQPVWKPGSPAGYDDIAASWAAPDALVRRVELAQRLVTPLGDGIDPRKLGDTLFPGSLSAATREQVARAESVPTALALLLVSPDFQRR